jgi:hypothetical protein
VCVRLRARSKQGARGIILVHFLSASFARRIVHERLGELEVLLWSVELSCTWPCNGRLEGLVG